MGHGDTLGTVQQQGIVTSVQPLEATIICEEACAACRARGLCGMGARRRRLITAIRPPEDWTPAVGDQVLLVMHTRLGFKALWWTMGVPFLIVTLIVTACVLCASPDWLMGLLSIFGIAVYYLCLYLLKERIQHDIYFTIHHSEP